MIFAIGKESRFGQKVMREAGCPVVESDRPEELAAAILKVQAAPQSVAAGNFFLENCGMTNNSRQYARVIADPGAKPGTTHPGKE